MFPFNFIGFSTLYTISPESFTTENRGIGLAITNISTRLGGMASPILTGLFLEYDHGFEIAISMYAGCYVLGAIIMLFLKETRLTLKKFKNKDNELTT